MSKLGKVYLVGAGPGDRELISLKGARILQEADIVYYDYLVNERLLNFCNEKAEVIYVGKSSKRHHMPQSEINRLISEKAQLGKLVVRLKGGDPFVFGRGSEECFELKQVGVPFEIVPGITAAVAAPAYAGIPITHRRLSLGCAFITGHESGEDVDGLVDWSALADKKQTLIIYMGMKNLSRICEQMIVHGRHPDAAAAVIQNGSWGHQKTVVATLSTLPQIVREEKLTAPAIIVIGDVAELRQHLKWYEEKRLMGLVVAWISILNFRDHDLDQCEREGALVWELPLMRTDGSEVNPRFTVSRLIKRGGMKYLGFENEAVYELFINKFSEVDLKSATLLTPDKRLKDALERENLRVELVESSIFSKLTTKNSQMACL